MNLLIDLLLVIYVLVALLMVLVILMQRPKSEGLGAAWRCGHGKHFRRTNHKRIGEVHGMAGWHLFRAHLCIVDPLCP